MKKQMYVRINFSLDVKETDLKEVSDKIGSTFVWLLNTLGAHNPEVLVAETKPPASSSQSEPDRA